VKELLPEETERLGGGGFLLVEFVGWIHTVAV